MMKLLLINGISTGGKGIELRYEDTFVHDGRCLGLVVSKFGGGAYMCRWEESLVFSEIFNPDIIIFELQNVNQFELIRRLKSKIDAKIIIKPHPPLFGSMVDQAETRFEDAFDILDLFDGYALFSFSTVFASFLEVVKPNIWIFPFWFLFPIDTDRLQDDMTQTDELLEQYDYAYCGEFDINRGTLRKWVFHSALIASMAGYVPVIVNQGDVESYKRLESVLSKYLKSEFRILQGRPFLDFLLQVLCKCKVCLNVCSPPLSPRIVLMCAAVGVPCISSPTAEALAIFPSLVVDHPTVQSVLRKLEALESKDYYRNISESAKSLIMSGFNYHKAYELLESFRSSDFTDIANCGRVIK